MSSETKECLKERLHRLEQDLKENQAFLQTYITIYARSLLFHNLYSEELKKLYQYKRCKPHHHFLFSIL